MLFLDEAQKPVDYFSKFEETDLPSNSDVLIVLSQYLNCLEKIRSDNVVQSDYDDNVWYWRVGGKQSTIRTSPPKSFLIKIK
jgi:hypothetical protein